MLKHLRIKTKLNYTKIIKMMSILSIISWKPQLDAFLLWYVLLYRYSWTLLSPFCPTFAFASMFAFLYTFLATRSGLYPCPHFSLFCYFSKACQSKSFWSGSPRLPPQDLQVSNECWSQQFWNLYPHKAPQGEMTSTLLPLPSINWILL